MIHSDLRRLCSVLFTIFSISLILATGFIAGCGDEGDSATDIVNGDNTNGTVDPPDDPTVEEPDDPVVVEPKVSYKDEISPLLTQKCAFVGCHSVNAPAGGLDLTNYDAFKKGGNSGAAFIAKDGKGSLIVTRIDGTKLPIMPLGGVPLNQDEVQLFIDWIDEGAENN